VLGILRTPNAAMWWVVGSAFVFLGMVLYVPFLRTLFHFSFLHPCDLALCAGVGAVSLAWLEGLKAYERGHSHAA
jgi:Ca2+-transporting ATPase